MKNKIVACNNIALDSRSKYLRSLVIECLENEKRGHVGSAMSLIEILRVLFDKFIKKNISKFILSKGHGCLALYSILYDKKFITKKDLLSVGKFNSKLGGHPEHDKVNGVEISTGALGHGLPFATGMALASKIKKKSTKYYVVCGDGEMNEGSIWESMMSISKHKLDNIILIIDYNKIQSYDFVKNVCDLSPLSKKLKSFNFKTFEVNGHDIRELEKVFIKAKNVKGKAVAIICHTVKGKGVKIAENNPEWHHKSFLGSDEMKKIKESIVN